MNDQQNSSFLDPKTVLAIFLLGAVWIGWQIHLKKKYPDAYGVTAQKQVTDANNTDEVVANDGSGEQATTKAVGLEKSEVNIAKPINKVVEERFLSFKDSTWSFSISSKGMGIKDIQLNTYTDRDGNHKKITSNSKSSFVTFLAGRRNPIDFEVTKEGDNLYIGYAEVDGLKIVKKMLIDSDNYLIDTDIKVEGVNDSFLGLVTTITDDVREIEGGSSFLPQFERQEVYVGFDNTDERLIVQKDESMTESFAKVNLLALSTQYFTLALLDKSQVLPEAKVKQENNHVFGTTTHQMINKSKNFNVKYAGFAGPKDLNLLENISPMMGSVVDFGMFSSIGRVILRVMKAFYKVVGNWGLAIVLLTLLVRLIVFPFNMMSYKSMKGMQVIQPRLKELREKYADDKMKLNQETMALMKEANANPLGGCLPMLLQFPIFIALYQVIGQSIELYQAPFGLWIGDLSLKDPYYVLPVLMGVTIFLQQKMTPTQMDPAQQKIMMLMPLFFMIFMVTLPSGLTLYMFVSALFAVVQQAYFMRDDIVGRLVKQPS